ncbi:MAG: VOC family protein, partial [Rhodospirillales bacterium]|nr:VOC family protein [Rhodospirillales bacterium]
MEHSDYPAPHDAWRAQKPAAGRLTLDHCAHFVPDIERASAALARLGFTLTPFSAQHHRMTPSEPLVPAGTGNRCIMLRRGYLEFLTPTADTPIAGRLRAAIHRYTGPHLVCFGVADAGAAHAHLASEGFDPLPVVALERQIGTPAGEDTARFAVVRTPPDKMPEGRIQFVEHRTPELLWQERWLAHANRAVGLDAAILCVANPAAVAARYARFTGLPTEKHDGAWRLATAHGALLFLDPDDCAR